jgi:hypothetical protein
MAWRWSAALVGSAWLAACGSSALKTVDAQPHDGGLDLGVSASSDDAAGAAASAGAAGADAAPAAGTGAAGAAGTGAAGAAGTGAAGAAGTGAAGAPSCGGDLVGTWWGTDLHARPHDPPPPADPCYGLTVSAESDGTFGAYSRMPLPERRDALLKFDAGRFEWSIVDRGPVTVTFAASCLDKTTPRPTCAQLGAALLMQGLGEGNVQKVACADAAGGCACMFSVLEIGGPAGQWSAADGVVTLVDSTSASQMGVQVPYCRDGSSLRFGAAIDTFEAGLGRMTFEPGSCTDGKQGVLEDGVDCGLYCPTPCP